MRIFCLLAAVFLAGPLSAASISYEQSTAPFAAYPASFGDVVVIEEFAVANGTTSQTNPAGLAITGAQNFSHGNGRLQRVAGNGSAPFFTTLTFLQTRLSALAIFVRDFSNGEFVDITFRDGGTEVETFQLTSSPAQNNGYYLITPSGPFNEVTFTDPAGAANAAQFNIDGIGGIEVVPLPAGVWLMLSALGALLMARRRAA